MSLTLDTAPGPRAAETRLLELLRAETETARRDPGLLASPLRVLVPSRSLRLHLGERVASELGATAGLVLQTLHAAAVEILERAGRAVPAGDLLVEVLARRLAREEDALREAFEPFQDGYRSVAGSVRDLLDAALEPAHLEALVERLDALSLPPDERRRALAVLRTASRVARELGRRETGGRAELLRDARAAFAADPAGTFPARGLLVHGFADATGRASDLIEALAGGLPTRVLVDLPPDPLEPARADLGVVFAERLLERLGAPGRSREPATLSSVPRASPDPPGPELFRAPGAQAEVREVARRVQLLLAAGTRPERIGIVARDLAPYATAVRTQLDRLGVPCSGVRAKAPLDGPARRVHALLDLLEEGTRCPADRWLDAVVRLPFERPTWSEAGELTGETERVLLAASPRLRLGLRVLGAGRLAGVAAVDPAARLSGRGYLKLPVPERFGQEPAREGRAARTTVAWARLQAWELSGAVRAAAALARRLARWPERATLAEHLAELERLRRKDLGWTGKNREEQRVAPALARLGEAFPDEPLAREELLRLLRRTLPAAAARRLAGQGGGVAVLDAMEARARTFEHLFLLGLNRDAFPRVGREDPLLGDDVRRALADLLPDVPIKARARDEDRYLFAQLLAAAEHVTLSWQLAADDGKPRVVSPLVDRLLAERDEEQVAEAPPLFPYDPEHVGPGERTARERLVLHGLHHGRAGHGARLELALREADPRGASAPGSSSSGLFAEAARGRERVLEAHERGPFEPWRLGPWLGFLGAQEEVGVRPDPAVEAAFVTRLEGLSRCPWQVVLEKFLGLREAPDPHDALPGIERYRVGNVAHAVLERIAARSLGASGGTLEEALERSPARTVWPGPEELDRLLLEAAAEAVREERAPTPGLCRMLAECARPFVEAGRAFYEDEERRHPQQGVAGVEVQGEARIPDGEGGSFPLAFRADRVDRRGETVILSDFKTGKAKRQNVFAQELPRGQSLQPMAYVLGVGERAKEARGRFLFLKEAEARDGVEIALDVTQAHLDAFARSVLTLFRGWRAGSFFPRLLRDDLERDNEACASCRVLSACLQGDSGARRALAAWVGEEGGEVAPPALASLRETFALSSAEAIGGKTSKKVGAKGARTPRKPGGARKAPAKGGARRRGGRGDA